MKNGAPAPFVLVCMRCTGTISSGGFFFHQAPLKQLILRLRRTTITRMLSLIIIWVCWSSQKVRQRFCAFKGRWILFAFLRR